MKTINLGNTGIQKVFSNPTVDEVKPSAYKPEIAQAQIRQLVTTKYPSKRVGNSLSDALFSTDAFNLGDGQTFESNRVCWVDVPLNTTKEQVEALLAAKPDAIVQRIISNDVMDVLTDEQKSAIARGIRTVEEYKESTLVRANDGSLLPGTPQYRQNFFKATYVEDVDKREAPANANAPAVNAAAALEAEMGK